MNPIYKPKGAAAEYVNGDGLALNIYTGCPHRCYYCYCPQVLRRDRREFFNYVEPRKNIVNEVKKQLERKKITGQLIHLCFIGDPYPTGYDTTATREVIQALKEYGNHVQILTKGDGSRDFDLLDGDDWYGVTISCDSPMSSEAEPCATTPFLRMVGIVAAKRRGINTWVSFEPVLDPKAVLGFIYDYRFSIDKVKIGKLNYHPSDIDWAKFGQDAEALCRDLGLDYYIKDSLRREMEKGGDWNG